ncbi:two-component sensor histidine kinase [Gordonia sp. PDNC005]|uniref:sensor histidine kinase n=1 Tax=unclassified Gordonia (in: high G+C Gram-positive bacteria) TaxID=2657482 RepID=UPI001965C06E|nr:histidine kinase [Gordonia sp. PDNC005]QRY60982.1 two-component sensor histidine kinase [Gordonia sp. PDNC005]
MRDPLAAPALRPSSMFFDVCTALVGGLIALANFEMSTAIHLADALICASLALRRISPSLMMVTAVVSATIQVVSLEVSALSLAYTVLFFTVGGHPDRRVRRGSLVVALVGSVVAGVTIPRAFPSGIADPEPSNFIWGALFASAGAALFVVGGWVTGFIGYQRRTVAAAEVSETIAELERRRVLDLYDEQAERSRLARDMHDVVAHSLAVVVAQAEGARYTLDANPEAARDALGVIADTAREALADVRSVLEELRSTSSAEEISRSDREQLFTRMRAAGMLIVVTDEGDATDVGPTVTRAAFGVLTEALTNALKYGDLARPVTVHHDWSEGCRLTVRNTLSDDPLAPGGAHHGIIGMTERAAHAGGTLRSARDGDDWLVVLHIPNQEGLPR